VAIWTPHDAIPLLYQLRGKRKKARKCRSRQIIAAAGLRPFPLGPSSGIGISPLGPTPPPPPPSPCLSFRNQRSPLAQAAPRQTPLFAHHCITCLIDPSKPLQKPPTRARRNVSTPPARSSSSSPSHSTQRAGNLPTRSPSNSFDTFYNPLPPPGCETAKPPYLRRRTSSRKGYHRTPCRRLTRCSLRAAGDSAAISVFRDSPRPAAI
jgi:hypothetical protein